MLHNDFLFASLFKKDGFPLNLCVCSLSPGLLDFFQLMPILHPIFYIAAITAHIAYHRDFPNQHHSRDIDIISACMTIRIVRHTDDVL